MAQADAQNQEDLTVAAAQMVAAEMGADAIYVTTEAPPKAQQEESLASADDEYQASDAGNSGQRDLGSAEADQTQMNDLATADAAYTLACAQADKDRAVNQTNHVAGQKKGQNDFY